MWQDRYKVPFLVTFFDTLDSFSYFIIFLAFLFNIFEKIISERFFSYTDKSCLKSKDREWYFFCPRERKYASGDRMKRSTATGYWKTTGKGRSIMYDERVVGMVQSLVFHEGNAPHGKRTDWMIYEYRMDDNKLADDGVAQVNSFTCCLI